MSGPALHSVVVVRPRPTTRPVATTCTSTIRSVPLLQAITFTCHDLFSVGFYFYPCFSFFSQFQWWKVIVLLSQTESSSVFLIRVWELPSEFFNKNLCVWSQWFPYWYQNLQVSLTCFLLIIFVDIKWKFCIFYNSIIFNLCVTQLFYSNL